MTSSEGSGRHQDNLVGSIKFSTSFTVGDLLPATLLPGVIVEHDIVRLVLCGGASGHVQLSLTGKNSQWFIGSLKGDAKGIEISSSLTASLKVADILHLRHPICCVRNKSCCDSPDRR